MLSKQKLDTFLALQNIKQEGFYSYNQFLLPTEASKIANSVQKYADSVDNAALEINYGGSETRIWNAQTRMPELSEVYAKLKQLNDLLFKDDSDFCVLAILTRPTPLSFYANRWHVDSLSSQYKFFLHLSNVSNIDGPFEFVSKSHTLKSRMARSLKYPYSYLKPTFTGLKRTYRSIPDSQIPQDSFNKSFLCSAGDLLIADVRMLHRDSPCFPNGSRIALHCYLGIDPKVFPCFPQQ